MDPPFTLPFDTFWKWLMAHPNCILRAGTPEAVLYDDEDLHWHFASEGEATLLVQVLRGKRLLGEIFLLPDQIAYVQGVPGDEEDEHIFELVLEGDNERLSTYFFGMAHPYEEEKSFTPGRVH